MKPQNRDLLVLSKKGTNNKKELELEVEKLNRFYYMPSRLQTFVLLTK
jgi:hypothetical protein